MWNLKAFELIYSRYKSSGLKVRDFCANEVINEAKFYYWQKKLREQKLPAQSFVPIVLDSSSASSLSRTTEVCHSRTGVFPSEYEILLSLRDHPALQRSCKSGNSQNVNPTNPLMPCSI